jgi:hypothetical protein
MRETEKNQAMLTIISGLLASGHYTLPKDDACVGGEPDFVREKDSGTPCVILDAWMLLNHLNDFHHD